MKTNLYQTEIARLLSKRVKDLGTATKELNKLNSICNNYNVTLQIVPSYKDMFNENDNNYIVVNTTQQHISLTDIKVFGNKAQHILENINTVLYQVTCTENKLLELRKLQNTIYNTTIDLIDELEVKNFNTVDLITWHMVKRNIVGTLEEAQDVINHLYKSKTIQIVNRIYTSSSVKVFVQVVPVTEIDEEYPNCC